VIKNQGSCPEKQTKRVGQNPKCGGKYVSRENKVFEEGKKTLKGKKKSHPWMDPNAAPDQKIAHALALFDLTQNETPLRGIVVKERDQPKVGTQEKTRPKLRSGD